MDDEIDAEVAALTAFSARMTRGRRAVGVPCIVAGLVLGVAAFIWAQMVGPDGAAGLALGVLLFALPFGASLYGGVFFARRYTASARDAWLAELADEYGVPLDELRERAEMFE